MKGLLALLGAVSLLVVAAVVGWWFWPRSPMTAEEPKPAVERAPFAPVRLATACIAAVEKPNGTKALLADAGAEVYRSSLETLGFICSTPTAGDGRKYDLIFATTRSSAAGLAQLVADHLGEAGVLVQVLDAFELAGTRFKTLVDGFPCNQVHLWMPGVFEWLLVGRVVPRRLKLEAMMEVFAREAAFELLAEAQTTALSDLFAGYVGTRADWGEALGARMLDQVVKPAFFVTKEIPALDWIDRGEVDEDIFRLTMAEIRSMQVVRRLVLEGELASTAGQGEAATDAWARARRRNPKDLFLLERCDRLRRNASALERIGNFGAAVKCYETLIVIDPTAVRDVSSYALCLKRMGRMEEARRIFQHVQEMRK